METAEATDIADTDDHVQISVVVACSPAAGQVEQVALSLPQHATVWQAIERSGLIQRFSAFGASDLKLGVWGQQRGRNEPLRHGDRVEIYRPLLIDPKDARRQRSQRTRAAKGRV